ncbi:MAG: membrane integrity-associated transporter subunit PqiC, partial [Planctomycetaceae bacterium]|nr:membrane integrity-associated transporter subunit PqiC [Planctomycetaceae bacterium]
MKHAWALVLVAAAGCVDLKSAYPDRRFYLLETARAGAERATSAGTVLRVRRVSASKMCDGSELVTRTADAVYESDFYNVMFVPPAAQIGEQAQRWLAGSKLFGHVVGAGSSIPETHVLEANLVSLHGDLRHGDAAAAVLEIQFLLVQVGADPATVVLQKTYREAVVCGAEPAQLVKGWSEGLAKILAALEADVASAIKSAT